MRALSEILRSSFLTLLEADHAVRKEPLVTIKKRLEAFPWVVMMVKRARVMRRALGSRTIWITPMLVFGNEGSDGYTRVAAAHGP